MILCLPKPGIIRRDDLSEGQFRATSPCFLSHPRPKAVLSQFPTSEQQGWIHRESTETRVWEWHYTDIFNLLTQSCHSNIQGSWVAATQRWHLMRFCFDKRRSIRLNGFKRRQWLWWEGTDRCREQQAWERATKTSMPFNRTWHHSSWHYVKEFPTWLSAS